uniref:Uncharacterized protein n=1 Tax=Candidatus Kentrum sp. LPFa TaxID=2126335 RepID=A0A450XFJ6_9GAMM|nr:MAG: hypothetical protein BECKLPF1236C_GA0070990_100577 [Candidatus Kentron sp. LPFa]
MNWVSLPSDLEIKPKFNDPVIPAGYVIPAEAGTGSSAMDGASIARKFICFPLGFTNASSFNGSLTSAGLWFIGPRQSFARTYAGYFDSKDLTAKNRDRNSCKIQKTLKCA